MDSESTTLLRILHYTPNRVAAAVVGVIYILIASGLFFRIFKTKSWWGLCMPIGAVCMGVGFFVRIVNAVAANQNSMGLYIMQQLMIVLSPAAYLAFNYILFGRFLGQCVGPEHSPLAAEKFKRVFVTSDVVTFLIQAGGGALEAFHNTSVVKIGAHIFLAGLALQTVSYVVFITMVLYAHRSIKKSGEFTGKEQWWKIIWLLYFSSAFILVRCAYRLIEGGQGHGGYLLTHEVYFYVFDINPLAWAIGIYIFFWPGKYLKAESWPQQGNAYPMVQGRADLA